MFSKHLTARESRLAGGQAAVIFELFGLFGEVAAAHPEGKLGIRKFKAILLGLPGLAQCFLQVTDVGRGFERFLFRFGESATIS
ncbi:MAG TPA: hypothetical protein VEV85_15410 [Bryobacteraceae bacterium]|nr:hypothetical protein [Bryobacteraceae bacterium]